MELRFSKIVSMELKKAEMLLYGTIGQDINAASFASELSWLSREYSEITIRVNSEGGYVADGLGILGMMMASTARIIVHIDGIAASMAAVVVAGADEVVMNDFALLMVHSPFFLDENNEKAENLSPKEKVVLMNLTNSLVQLLTKRGIEEAEVRRMLIAETWFNAEQALAAKLVDRIEETGRKLELAAYEPKRLVAKLIDEHTTNNAHTEMKKVIAKLKLPETADETAVVAAIEKLEADGAQLRLLTEKLLVFGKTLGVVTDKNEASMKKLAETDLGLFVDLFQVDNTKTAEQVRLSEVIAKMQPVTQPISKGGKELFDEMQKKGPRALAEWKQAKPEEYKSAYKEYWGEEPK